MTAAPKPIRIAIVLNGQEFVCHAVMLPFSLEGYPPVELVLYGRQPETPAPGLTVNLLPDLHPEGFDLILDGQFLTAGIADFSPDRLDNLVTGPAARFLKALVCQLQELRQKQEINAGVIMGATDGLITINSDHVIIGYNHGRRADVRVHPHRSPGPGSETHYSAAVHKKSMGAFCGAIWPPGRPTYSGGNGASPPGAGTGRNFP